MFSLTSKSRKSITILSAGAAALLITGLGVSNATAANLTWDPSGSSAGASNGSGTWNSSGTYWYNGTGAQAWTNVVPADGAYFGTGSGSGTYTVSLGSSSGTYSTANLGVNNSGNSYVLDGIGGTVASSGQLVVNGNLALENITVNNTTYTQSGVTTVPYVSNGATLNIGSGATLAGNFIAAGSYGGSGVINVNNGGTLSGYSNIYVNNGSGSIGSALNVYTGGAVSELNNFKNLFLSSVTTTPGANSNSGTVNVDGGTMTVGAITVYNGYDQTGTININSGSVTCLAIAAITNKSSSSAASHTVVNLNGGTLNANWITSQNNADVTVNFNGGTLQSHTGGGIGAASSAYTIPTNLNVQAGGAVIDSNSHAYWIQSLLLHDATLGSTPDGGLTVLDSPSAIAQQSSTVTLQGVNTYTGPTTVLAGGNLVLGAAKTVPIQGSKTQALAAATIADSSSVTIASSGVLTLANDVTSANVAPTAATQIQALNMSGGGSISFFLNATQSPSLSIGTKASISGVNTINVFAVPGTASFTMGTYTLITDSLGGLSGGTFEFGNGQQTATTGVLSGGSAYLLTLGSSDTAETLTISAVPEPATLGLFAIGGVALLLLGRKRKAQI